MIKLIACIGPNGELGLNNDLIYHNKRDMKFFREQTKENIVIMGKNTFKSIGSKPLPDRINIVLTEESESYPGVLTWNMPLENALRNAKAWFPMLDIYIIGGAYVYNQAIEQRLPDELLLKMFSFQFSLYSNWYNYFFLRIIIFYSEIINSKIIEII